MNIASYNKVKDVYVSTCNNCLIKIFFNNNVSGIQNNLLFLRFRIRHFVYKKRRVSSLCWCR